MAKQLKTNLGRCPTRKIPLFTYSSERNKITSGLIL